MIYVVEIGEKTELKIVNNKILYNFRVEFLIVILN